MLEVQGSRRSAALKACDRDFGNNVVARAPTLDSELSDVFNPQAWRKPYNIENFHSLLPNFEFLFYISAT